MTISKSVRSDRSHSNTRPPQPTRSTMDHSTDSTSGLKAPSPSSSLPPTNSSSQNTLRKPVLKKIPIAQLEVDPERAVAVSTPLMDRGSTLPHSKSQPLIKSTPVGNNSTSLLNGNAKEQRENNARLSDASTVSSLLKPAARLANSNKPKIVFEKVGGTDSTDADRKKQGKPEQSFGAWHQPLDKFVQESSVWILLIHLVSIYQFWITFFYQRIQESTLTECVPVIALCRGLVLVRWSEFTEMRSGAKNSSCSMA